MRLILLLTATSTLIISLALLPILSARAEFNSVPSSVAKSSEKLFNTRKFSLRYPESWIIYSQSSDSLILYNQRPPRRGGGEAPPFMIKTDVTFVPGSLENYPQPSRDPNIKVVQTQKLTINGRQAIREWAVGGEAFSNSVATYVQYSDRETAVVISFYNAENRSSAEAVIQKIHSSFKLP